MIGYLAKYLQAATNNLTDLSFRIFERRLTFSKKFQTPFAPMVEHTYENRWNGKGRYAWSFGLTKEMRGLQIISVFKKNLAPGSLWSFDYNGWKFPVYSSAGNYYIRHAHASEVPLIRRELERLWENALSGNVESLYQFEWLWYRTNPFGRAGATTGSVLSILIQKHLDMKPQKCIGHDLVALSTSVDNYAIHRSS